MKRLSILFTISVFFVTSILFIAKAQVPFPGSGSGGGGTIVTVAAPYITVGATKYVMATGWPFTAFFSGSFLDANTCTLTAGTNGSENVNCALNNTNAWYSIAATTSVEAEFEGVAGTSAITAVLASGIWLCDTTNSKVYSLEKVESPSGTNGNIFIQLSSWTLTGCAGTPSAVTSLTASPVLTNNITHLKIAKVSTNIVSSISQDGGQTFTQFDSRAVGTIAKGGVDVRTTTATETVSATFLSVVVN